MNLAHLEHFTPYHIHNIETLAEFLMSADIPPPRFDMRDFMTTELRYELQERFVSDLSPRASTLYAIPEVYNHCGTTACAVGHGPLAGIPALADESWNHYSLRVFGCSNIGKLKTLPAFNFMFGPDWKGRNNTAKGTALRMQYFLKHGIPEGVFPDWSKDHVNLEARANGVWLDGLTI